MNRIFFGKREILFADTLPDIPCQLFEFNKVADWHDFIRKDFTEDFVCVHCLDPRADFQRFLQHFTVIPAAGGLVQCKFPSGGLKYLYIFRNGMWDLPKGKKEAGESEQTNALREVEEETGLKGLEIRQYIDHTYHFMPDKENRVPLVKQTAWFSMHIPAPQTPVPQTEEGIARAQWLTLSEIKNILGLMYTSVATLSNRFLFDSVQP